MNKAVLLCAAALAFGIAAAPLPAAEKAAQVPAVKPELNPDWNIKVTGKKLAAGKEVNFKTPAIPDIYAYVPVFSFELKITGKDNKDIRPILQVNNRTYTELDKWDAPRLMNRKNSKDGGNGLYTYNVSGLLRPGKYNRFIIKLNDSKTACTISNVRVFLKPDSRSVLPDAPAKEKNVFKIVSGNPLKITLNGKDFIRSESFGRNIALDKLKTTCHEVKNSAGEITAHNMYRLKDPVFDFRREAALYDNGELEFTFRASAAPKKILAVDADETLWKGVLSEDGEENLVPMKVFQEGLLQLRADGVLLVLLSKNDPFAFRADMPLSLSDFAAARVGWSPKPEALAEVCRDLSLAVDSVVFVDDNSRERSEMSARLEGVAVAPWNGWRTGDETEQRQLLRRLRECFFAGSGATDEDRLRAAEYSRRAMLRDLQGKFGDIDGYLKDLNLTVRPSLAEEGDLERLSQMAMRTNQFNATTIRRTRDEFAELAADAGMRVYVFRAADRFGDQGLVCYVVADVAARKITDFVMSCRAMGRTLEHFVYRYVSRELGFEPEVDYVPTAKNRPFAEFISVLGENRRTWYEVDSGHAG